ncbi:helix-turn-helix domain-containing protein [Pseudoalteromonas sp. SCQQ13]|uniref:helix-turn-helix domain-containing protein n=1 Tax=Pseudoalteromonas sp. SCQQ13 TaxID=2792066 RepID=UPI0018CCACB1|nr:helix-turn-helix transcriptional regulator [Pseudoalteromonas sp. SCQQ13]MBH0093438.1 helix-turn-helix transcriptional regulator [Pseudoalteromonas sp. SCQQ13]
MNIVGKNIKQIRESKSWTQEVLVAKCQIKQWEITRSTLAKIESNVRRVTDIEVKRFAQIFDVSIDELFSED